MPWLLFHEKIDANSSHEKVRPQDFLHQLANGQDIVPSRQREISHDTTMAEPLGNPSLSSLNFHIIDTLWWTNIAIENGHLYWIFPLKMVIFHCYVSSPEGIIIRFPYHRYHIQKLAQKKSALWLALTYPDVSRASHLFISFRWCSIAMLE